MIYLQELQDLNEEQIVDLRLEQKCQPFKIFISKSTKKFYSEREAIAIDYAELAYCGQRLNDISARFEYGRVSPEDNESVLFKITTSELNKLAETLLEISYGYINDSENEDFIFAELVEGFLEGIETCKITPACPYFFEVYKEYKTEENG